MRPAIEMLTSDFTYVTFLGYYELTEIFIPNSWNCPDRPVGHSLNEEVQEVTSWCGAEWQSTPELIESTGKEVSICLKCVRAYEKHHYGVEHTRRPEDGV